jgi:hypothetical protein
VDRFRIGHLHSSHVRNVSGLLEPVVEELLGELEEHKARQGQQCDDHHTEMGPILHCSICRTASLHSQSLNK